MHASKKASWTYPPQIFTSVHLFNKIIRSGFTINSPLFQNNWVKIHPGGGTDLERWYGDVRPWRPPFHASPAARKGPISSKRVSSQDPLLRKFGNFSLYSLNFHPNFSSQAPKFGNFQLTGPQIWKFSAHKPSNSEIFRSQAFQRQPLFRGKCQFASPTLRKSGPHTPTWKKVECPQGIHHRKNKVRWRFTKLSFFLKSRFTLKKENNKTIKRTFVQDSPCFKYY